MHCKQRRQSITTPATAATADADAATTRQGDENCRPIPVYTPHHKTSLKWISVLSLTIVCTLIGEFLHEEVIAYRYSS